MAGGVGHHEGASIGREIPIGDVDRNPLLALGLKAVEDQRIVELGALRANPSRVPLECSELVLEQKLGFVQEPADERALSVVDAPAGDEAQKRSALVQLQISLDLLLDRLDASAQKYPSCFLRSIEPAES